MKTRRKTGLFLTIAMIATLFSFYGDTGSTIASPLKDEGHGTKEERGYAPSVQGNLDYCTVRPESKIEDVDITKVAQLTGQDSINKTVERYDIAGTDLGSIFHMNGKMYYAFGDTFGAGSTFPPGTGPTYNWRSNVVGYSTDMDPTDGVKLDGFLQNDDGQAREIIPSKKIQGDHLTSIPTNGVAVKGKMYLYYMAIDYWWKTAYSGVYTSSDEGENWEHVEGLKWGTDSNFAQVSIVKPEQNRKVLKNDIYFYGVGAARNNPVTLMKVNKNHIEDKSEYLYFTGTDDKGRPQWSSNESDAVPILETTAGELSVVWNPGLDRWIMTYMNGETTNIDIAEAENPWGPWTEPEVLVRQSDYPGLYGSYMDPSFIRDHGKAIYFMMSQWGDYNVFDMKGQLELKNEKIDHLCTSLQSEKQSATAGETFKVKAVIQNTSQDRMTDVAVELDLPDGWETKNLTPARTDAVNPNHQFQVTYQVTTPVNTEAARKVLKGKVTLQRKGKQIEIPLKNTINLKSAVEIVSASVDPMTIERGDSTTVHVTLQNNRKKVTTGQFSLKTPVSWNVTPKQQSFELSDNQEKDFTFSVQPPDDFAGLAHLSVSALVDQKAVASKKLLLGVGGAYLSDLEWTNATNGWGPVEQDMSVGDHQGGDGLPITLNGVTYKKGLGVHAYSEIVYDLNGEGSRFTTDVGVDDEAADSAASKMAFQVWGDGKKLYDSGPMTPTSETNKIDISIKDIQKLKLIVTNGNNGNAWDHGDWANAWVTYRK